MQRDGFPLVEERETEEGQGDLLKRFPSLAKEGPGGRAVNRAGAEDRCPYWHPYFLTVYYFLFFMALFWFALDVWGGQFNLLRNIGLENLATLMTKESPERITFVIVSYTAIGGAMGSILYSIRCFFDYFAGRHRRNYSRRWFGKYITAPWEGAAMAMVVASLLRGGVAVFSQSGGAVSDKGNAIAPFAIGTLVGFSMREVVGWLQRVTITMFGVPDANTSVKNGSEAPIADS